MTLKQSDPWAQITPPPPGSFHRLRVDLDSHAAIYWIRDGANRLGVLFEIDRRTPIGDIQRTKIRIRDITVDVIEIAGENLRALTVKLEDEQKRDIFLKLCIDLIERITADVGIADVFYVVSRRLAKWQALLSGRSRSLLSQKEVQGLFAELYFVAEMISDKFYSESELIEGWQGPDGIQQDFILEDTAIEIKSLMGNERGIVRISSEDQLDSHLEQLFLRVYLMSASANVLDGESLNQIVARISGLLVSPQNFQIFESKLQRAGYIDIPDYDAPVFLVKKSRTYAVTQGFPRITRGGLASGIEAVTYNLVLAEIANFQCDLARKKDH